MSGAYGYARQPGPHSVVGFVGHTALGAAAGAGMGAAGGAAGHGIATGGTKLLSAIHPAPTLRGMSDFGGVLTRESENAAGGALHTATGGIAQKDFGGLINSSLMKGDDVHLLTGTHGAPDGTHLPDSTMYDDDVNAFGDLPGVTVHNFPAMSTDEVKAVLEKPGTIIGGFCDSKAVLAGYK